ncbi:MAG: DUF4157 domain-containing protein [Cyanobacteria bacterium J06639_16]
MKTRQSARKPVQDMSGMSAKKLLQTRPFQAVKTTALQSAQCQEASESLSKGFDLTTAQAFSVSNQPISALGQPLQAKLTIGQPNDKYEQEADRVARQVVKNLNPSVSKPANRGDAVQRIAVDEEVSRLQAKPLAHSVSPLTDVKGYVPLHMKLGPPQFSEEETAKPKLESEINQARNNGQALDSQIRQPMEQEFGTDFSNVKIHTDSRSDQLNRSLSSTAFTSKQDIFFRQGVYQPTTPSGQELLAHELTHVVQQNGSLVQPSKTSLLQRHLFKDKNTDKLEENEAKKLFIGELKGSFNLPELPKWEQVPKEVKDDFFNILSNPSDHKTIKEFIEENRSGLAKGFQGEVPEPKQSNQQQNTTENKKEKRAVSNSPQSEKNKETTTKSKKQSIAGSVSEKKKKLPVSNPKSKNKEQKKTEVSSPKKFEKKPNRSNADELELERFDYVPAKPTSSPKKRKSQVDKKKNSSLSVNGRTDSKAGSVKVNMSKYDSLTLEKIEEGAAFDVVHSDNSVKGTYFLSEIEYNVDTAQDQFQQNPTDHTCNLCTAWEQVHLQALAALEKEISKLGGAKKLAAEAKDNSVAKWTLCSSLLLIFIGLTALGLETWSIVDKAGPQKFSGNFAADSGTFEFETGSGLSPADITLLIVAFIFLLLGGTASCGNAIRDYQAPVQGARSRTQDLVDRANTLSKNTVVLRGQYKKYYDNRLKKLRKPSKDLKVHTQSQLNTGQQSDDVSIPINDDK